MIAEELLHFIWQFRLFDQLELYSTDDEQIKIFQVGQCNKDAGPDFLFTRISLGGREWRGHVEIHVDGADWFAHKHHEDAAYNSVVLHVVLHNPVTAIRQDGTAVPCLELGALIDDAVFERYRGIMQNLHWIPCEKLLPQVDVLYKMQMLQRMTVARLEERYIRIIGLLEETRQDWERVLFLQLCRSFGMKVNAQPFLELGKLVDLSLIRKYRGDHFKIEVMLLGQAGFLADVEESGYVGQLAGEYRYLKAVHALAELRVLEWKFMRMRPYNFPTFRLAQLAALYSRMPYLFEKLMTCGGVADIQDVLSEVRSTTFWETHFTLRKGAPAHTTALSVSFIEHLIVNAFVPILFAYGKYMGLDKWQN